MKKRTLSHKLFLFMVDYKDVLVIMKQTLSTCIVMFVTSPNHSKLCDSYLKCTNSKDAYQYR